MGGYGSTRWAWHTKATTVEDCRSISVSDFHHKGFLEPGRVINGNVKWYGYRDAEVASLGFVVGTWEDAGNLELSYTMTGSNVADRRMEYTVPLQTTRPYFGGLRWWFTCPDCDRRVGKLYRPPNEDKYLCRYCHKLSYTSCQESDQRVSNIRGLGPWGILEMMKSGNLDDLIMGMKALPDWV